MAERHTEQRHHLLGQAENGVGFAGVVAQAADVHAAQTERFGGEQYVLRHNAGIDGADQYHFCPIGLHFGIDFFVFGQVKAEHQKLGAGFDIVLVGTDRAQLFALLNVGYPHDVGGLQKAGSGSGLAGA